MIGEIKAFLDNRIDINRPVFSGALARVEKHVLDDRISSLAMLYDLIEVASQHVHELGQLRAFLSVKSCLLQSLADFIDKLGRNCREIVDEIKRVFDLVRNAGG